MSTSTREDCVNFYELNLQLVRHPYCVFLFFLCSGCSLSLYPFSRSCSSRHSSIPMPFAEPTLSSRRKSVIACDQNCKCFKHRTLAEAISKQVSYLIAFSGCSVAILLSQTFSARRSTILPALAPISAPTATRSLEYTASPRPSTATPAWKQQAEMPFQSREPQSIGRQRSQSRLSLSMIKLRLNQSLRSPSRGHRLFPTCQRIHLPATVHCPRYLVSPGIK